MPFSSLRIFSDGASRGNPGEAGIGVTISDTDGNHIEDCKKFLGKTTNNVAEWTALIVGLEKAKEYAAQKVECYLDSELVVKQMKGEYRVKQPHLQPLFAKAKELERSFEKVSYTHVPREQNTQADRLSNEAIDEKS